MKGKKDSSGLYNKATDNHAVPGTSWNGKESTGGIVNKGNPSPFNAGSVKHPKTGEK